MEVLQHAWMGGKGAAAPPEWIMYTFCHSIIPGLAPAEFAKLDYDTVCRLMICYEEANKMRAARG